MSVDFSGMNCACLRAFGKYRTIINGTLSACVQVIIETEPTVDGDVVQVITNSTIMGMLTTDADALEIVRRATLTIDGVDYIASDVSPDDAGMTEVTLTRD